MLDKLTNSNNLSNDFKVKQVEAISQTKPISAEKHEQPEPKGNTREKTEKVIDSMNDFLKASNTHLKFKFHDDLQKYYVAIVDDTTNEVIREIPPKKLLDMYAAMEKYLGLLVDKKA
ncbi:flagellar protein FlaG [Neobacillus niacini]|uniref:flagellar protein FlaG n=1 Tax=Neobacillus niacini TaxID=86668 RepID=UPI002864646A|nr:flagellar protein FlaG [Neobacillus niacini]MDR7000981.1 flagellar protein FlaG [Neobacillus niacini]